eukprot:346909-Prymnesium_polylepis.1
MAGAAGVGATDAPTVAPALPAPTAALLRCLEATTSPLTQPELLRCSEASSAPAAETPTPKS